MTAPETIWVDVLAVTDRRRPLVIKDVVTRFENERRNWHEAYHRHDAPPEVVATMPGAALLQAAMIEAAAENKEQLQIWAHEIVVALGFADVLKITSYEDNIEAHDTVGRELVEIIRALAAQCADAGIPGLFAKLTAAAERWERVEGFIADFAAAKIDALPMPHVRHPADEPDPVVDAETVWAWQADARAALDTKGETK